MGQRIKNYNGKYTKKILSRYLDYRVFILEKDIKRTAGSGMQTQGTNLAEYIQAVLIDGGYTCAEPASVEVKDIFLPESLFNSSKKTFSDARRGFLPSIDIQEAVKIVYIATNACAQPLAPLTDNQNPSMSYRRLRELYIPINVTKKVATKYDFTKSNRSKTPFTERPNNAVNLKNEIIKYAIKLGLV